MRRLPASKLLLESLEVRDMFTVIHIDSAWVQQAAGNPIVPQSRSVSATAGRVEQGVENQTEG